MEKQVSPGRSGKKRYASPRLVSHGDVDKITQQGGHSFTDVPQGTPVNGDISNVAT